MSERDTNELSEVGRIRREAMLGDLLGDLRDVHAGRRMRRRIAVMAGVGVMLVAAVLIAMPRRAAPPVQHAAQLPPAEAIEQTVPPRMVVDARVIKSDPVTVDQYLVHTSAHRASIISDDELLAALEAIGRPTGLVRTNGRVWLTALVTDEERRNGL